MSGWPQAPRPRCSPSCPTAAGLPLQRRALQVCLGGKTQVPVSPRPSHGALGGGRGRPCQETGGFAWLETACWARRAALTSAAAVPTFRHRAPLNVGWPGSQNEGRARCTGGATVTAGPLRVPGLVQVGERGLRLVKGGLGLWVGVRSWSVTCSRAPCTLGHGWLPRRSCWRSRAPGCRSSVPPGGETRVGCGCVGDVDVSKLQPGVSPHKAARLTPPVARPEARPEGSQPPWQVQLPAALSEAPLALAPGRWWAASSWWAIC